MQPRFGFGGRAVEKRADQVGGVLACMLSQEDSWDSASSLLITIILLQQKDMKQNHQREKGRGAKSRGYKALEPKSPLSVKSHRCAFFPLSPLVTIPCEMFSTGEVFLSLGVKGFTGGWTCKLHLPRLCRNSRLPAGKQLLSIIHVVCTKNFATVNPLF